MHILLAHIIDTCPTVVAHDWTGPILLAEPSLALLLLILCGIAILAKVVFCHGARIIGVIGTIAGVLLLGSLLLGFLTFASREGSHVPSHRSHIQSAERRIVRSVERNARKIEINARIVERKVEQIAKEAEKLDKNSLNYEEALNKLNKLRIRLVEGTDESAHQPAATTELKVDSDSESDADGATDSTRPAWVDKARTRVGDVQRRVVKVGPWESVAECHRELGLPVLKITREYVRQEFAEQASNGKAFSTDDLRKMGIDEAFVLHEICTDEFVETTEHDFGGEDREMVTLHVLMEFSPSVHKALQHRLHDYQRQQKATIVSLVAGGVLGVLGLIYGLLKVDTWTKGYYTRRLWIGVPVAVIGTLAAIALFV